MNKGFSLVELIVVIAIMAILVGVAVPVYTSYIDKANDSVDKTQVDEVDRAITVLLIDQEVPNPIDDESNDKKFTIKLSKGTNNATTWTLDGATDTDGKFVNALKDFCPDTSLKTNKTITFEVNLSNYTVSNDAETVLDD